MTNCALKVLAACPKSLLDLGVLTEFDSDGGVVLVDSKNKLDNAISSWGGSDFNKKEANKYAESLEYLHARKAIVDFMPTYNLSQATSDLNAVDRDLKNQDSLIDFAIFSDDISGKISIGNHAKFHGSEHVQKNKRKLMRPGKITVNMTSADLAKKMTPYAFDCNTFKIIDPFIFEFARHRYSTNRRGENIFFQKIKDKLSFLFELFMQIEKYNSYQPSDIKIEIFGRSYKTNPTQNLDLADIKAGLLRVGKLPDYVRKYNVKFIGLDDRSQKKQGKLGFHERFFYTDKFIFEIENSFEEIPRKTQILKFALQQEREDLFQRFNDKGENYDLVFTLGARDFR